jgi:hypothetical protein
MVPAAGLVSVYDLDNPLRPFVISVGDLRAPLAKAVSAHKYSAEGFIDEVRQASKR